jgi:hypothetical protein
MFWPVGYLIASLSIFVLMRRLKKNYVTVILCVCVVLQGVDTRAGWHSLKIDISSHGLTYQSSLTSPLWGKLLPHYENLRIIPPGSKDRFYEDIAFLAAEYGLPTDSVYLARYDHQRVQNLFRQTENMLRSGRYDAKTLYVVPPEEKQAAWFIRQTPKPEHVWIGEIDGYIVIAPGWQENHFGENF